MQVEGVNYTRAQGAAVLRTGPFTQFAKEGSWVGLSGTNVWQSLYFLWEKAICVEWLTTWPATFPYCIAATQFRGVMASGTRFEVSRWPA